MTWGSEHDRSKREVGHPGIWASLGLGLLGDCLRALFDFRKPKDESWQDFLLAKLGALALALVVIGLVASVLFVVILRSAH